MLEPTTSLPRLPLRPAGPEATRLRPGASAPLTAALSTERKPVRRREVGLCTRRHLRCSRGSMRRRGRGAAPGQNQRADHGVLGPLEQRGPGRAERLGKPAGRRQGPAAAVGYRGGKPPRCAPPRPPRKPPRSPRKLDRFRSRPRPAEVPPLPPPRGAPPPRSDLDLGGGDLGRSLSISSVQPVR